MSDIVSKLRDDAFVCHIGNLARESKLLHAAADEIERLRAERDEARMWICRFDAESRSKYARRCGMSDYDYTPLQMARERGWDCFKEDA